MERRREPAAGTTESILLPIHPSASTTAKNNMKDAHHYDDGCDEHRKKRTVTRWRRRQRQVFGVVVVVSFIAVLGLTAQGYHRRHQARLQNEQLGVWNKFRTEHKVETRFPRMKQFLSKNPIIAKKWETYLKETKKQHVFEDTVEPDHQGFRPQGTFDETVDALGSAAETLAVWMHENAEPFLGEDMVHSVAETLHGAIDAAGDFTDDISRSFSEEMEEWGQALYDMLGATSESVAQWMESVTNATTTTTNGTLSDSWAEWTTAFFRSPASLWNYTTEQEEKDDETADQDDTNSASGKYDETSIAFRVGQIKPRPVPEKTDRKFAFITNGFPMSDDEWRLETFVLGALQTWLQDSFLFYIVSVKATEKIQAMCAIKEHEEACERLYPIYVNCPAKDYGIATCCKQDKGMAKIASFYPKFDWYVYHQDDIYFRADYLREFTDGLPNPKKEALLLSSSPFRPQGFIQPEPPFTPEAWKEASKRMKSNCSSSPNHIYPWGRPAVVYSNAALQMVVPGYKHFAISRICNAFQVSAGGGSPIVHWMYQLPVVRMPNIAPRIPNDVSAQISLMQKSRADESIPVEQRRVVVRRFNAVQRYVAFRADVGRFNFSGLHDIILAAQQGAKRDGGSKLYPGPPYTYQYHRPNGFTETEVFKDHGYPQNWTDQWHNYGPDDCIQAALTKGRNMLWHGQLAAIPTDIQKAEDIAKIQEQVLQKLDAAKQARARQKLEMQKLHQQKVLQQLSPGQKAAMLEKLELVKQKQAKRLANREANNAKRENGDRALGNAAKRKNGDQGFGNAKRENGGQRKIGEKGLGQRKNGEKGFEKRENRNSASNKANA